MKRFFFVAAVTVIAVATAAQPMSQETIDSTDVFYRHLQLKEVLVTGSTGVTRMADASAPVAFLSTGDLRGTAATNIVDAVSHLPGVSQITTGGGISKPVIRGLGYNRIIVVNNGVRQEGQQWGDEHGIEIDSWDVNSIEVLKGPASLVYGSDALAGVLKFNNAPVLTPGTVRAQLGAEYQTNNGLFGYTANFAGNRSGNIWSARYSEKLAHPYKNARDGYVPNSQFHERAGSLLLGLNRSWGHSHLLWSCYHVTPSIIEGERDVTTGVLIQPYSDATTYHHGMPYQQVKHYKAVLDNSFAVGGGRLNFLLAYQQNRRQEYEEAESPTDYGLFLKLHTLNYNIHYVTRRLGVCQVTAGVNGMYQKSVNKGNEYLVPDYSLFDFGVFATTSLTLGRWALNGGLRFDNRHMSGRELEEDKEVRFAAFHRDFTGITASAGTVFHASDRLDLRVNVSRGFRAPNISELASNGIHEGSVRYELGNVNLKPEFSLQFDLGVAYSSPVVEAQLNLFANHIANYIFIHRISDVMEEGYMTYRYDAGDSRLLGGEMSVDVHPFHSLHLSTSFSYVSAVQLHQPLESKYLPFTPAPRWQFEVKYEINHHGRLLNNTFVSAQWDQSFRQSHYYRADETETATPAYGLLNLQVGTDVMRRGSRVASLFLVVQNATNCIYQSHLSRLKYTDVDPVTGRRGIFNMGRNIVLKLIVPLQWKL